MKEDRWNRITVDWIPSGGKKRVRETKNQEEGRDQKSSVGLTWKSTTQDRVRCLRIGEAPMPANEPIK